MFLGLELLADEGWDFEFLKVDEEREGGGVEEDGQEDRTVDVQEEEIENGHVH